MRDLERGLRIGAYELLDLIGRTGMSEVWRAQRDDGQVVALKTISPHAGDDPQLRARFLREGSEHRLLKHPAIVPILDFFELNGDFYLIMQYIGGGSLADRLDQQISMVLPIPEALRIAGQILPALDYAHQRLVIHRDVKPSNILLDENRAFLSDFGIALVLGRPRLTGYVRMMGTHAYMSPEQIETPLAVTHLTDVYSFGCVLYEMLTGRQAYAQKGSSEESDYALLAARRYDPPVPPRAWNLEIPPRLERIVLTSLAADPQDRFPGCGSFARALAGIELSKSSVQIATAGPVPSPKQGGGTLLMNIRADISPKPDAKDLSPAPRKAPISVVSNVLASIVVGFLWIPFKDSGEEILGNVLLVCFALAQILVIRMLYKAWALLPPDHARATAGKAVGYLFIPFYNLYWCWNVLPGFAVDSSKWMSQSGVRPLRQSVTLYALLCVMNFYLPCAGFLLGASGFTGLTIMMDLMIVVPTMIAVLAITANRLAETNTQQVVPTRAEAQVAR